MYVKRFFEVFLTFVVFSLMPKIVHLLYIKVAIVGKRVDGWVDTNSYPKIGQNSVVIGGKLSIFCLLCPLMVFINPFSD